MPIKIIPIKKKVATPKPRPKKRPEKKKMPNAPKPRPKRGDLNDLQASRDYNRYYKKKKK